MNVTAKMIDERLDSVASEITVGSCEDCFHCRILKAVLESTKAKMLAGSVCAHYLVTGDPVLFARAYAMGMADGISMAESESIERMAL